MGVLGDSHVIGLLEVIKFTYAVKSNRIRLIIS